MKARSFGRIALCSALVLFAVLTFQNCSQSGIESNSSGPPPDDSIPLPDLPDTGLSPQQTVKPHDLFKSTFPPSWLEMIRTQLFISNFDRIPERALPYYLHPRDGQMSRFPKVLSIGDSISLCYLGSLRNRLLTTHDVYHPTHNGASTENGIKWIEEYMEFGPYPVVVVNWGLHDAASVVRTVNGTLQYTMKTPTDIYADRLNQLLSRIKNTGSRVLWVRTTPTLDPTLPAATPGGPYKANLNVHSQQYNQVSDRVVGSLGIARINLENSGALGFQDDRLHFDAQTCERFGQYIGDQVKGSIALAPLRTSFWHSQAWSVCANGTQSRQVLCTNAMRAQVAASECADLPRPAVRQSCENFGYEWFASGFGACVNGIRTRRVYCRSTKGTPFDDQFCTQPRPSLSETCEP